jgi:hypothetical protein
MGKKKMGTGAKVAIGAAVVAVLSGALYALTKKGEGTSKGGTPGGPTISVTIS